ncbi:hypothetical protein ONZ51_g5997 [Trametes cubensis]|uniref:Survival protein SurE-like phosphatase/nucleotidase domain-containing protein n=1 Tax=Trametes cubensis TaxID=1111947 RepID=A0AAD7TSV3_9APHY|nr:hypothetical protein ONZ51_g5997 [Trametes cubensis]
MWTSIASLLALLSSSAALNIILTNDDSWASANIRRWARRAPSRVSAADTMSMRFIADVGAPYFGHDVKNPDLFYFNGTPAAAVVFGIDILAPIHFGSNPIDLVVSGPNEGQNNGPFTFTLSGTVGATYTAVERGIPAVAFSAGNGTHRSFTTNTGDTSDPANLAAQVVVNIVRALSNNVNVSQERLLPLGIGMSVNIPTFGPGINCTSPPSTFTRLTGGATVNQITLDPTTGFPVANNLEARGVNANINGVRDDPGETPTSAGCETAVSIFSVDYDAPERIAVPIQRRLRKNIRADNLP